MNLYDVLIKNRLKSRNYAITLSLIAAIIVALSACGPKALNFSILGTGQSLTQGSLTNNKVDILWVIDNSGSMLTKQQSLANSFDSFTQVFLNKGFDFHIAIVTTDTRSSTDPNPLLRGQEGFFQGAPTVITGQTANFSNTFKANVVVGALGDAAAKGLDVIPLSLNTGNLNTVNAGFLREDAHLAVVVLSDADDTSSTETVASTMSFLQTLKPDKFDVLARTYKKNFTVSAVVVDLSNPANTACAAPFEDGTKFKLLANQSGGSITSICEADFSPGLLNLSKRIAEAITEIPLARAPQVSTIVITFNGVTIPQDSTDGWTYSSAGNKVVFHGNYIPIDHTEIGVGYIPADIIR